MQTAGRTLRRHGPPRLGAVRAGVIGERSVLLQGGRIIAGGFPSLAAAGARFERLQQEALRQAAPGLVEEPAPAAPTAAPADATAQAEPGDADNVVSLEAYHRRP